MLSLGNVQGSHTNPSRSVEEVNQASRRGALVSISVLLTCCALFRVLSAYSVAAAGEFKDI